ncbi:MAG: MBL fold metallo-hydrolase [Candidatus Levybacteria bacterium]|nr:MBL fold metallo-hydrolase [Candidatus Levybacteria bacterium]
MIYNDRKLHVVFCDVGQGDAIFIRTPNGSDILVDGGPDDSVLSCLGKHMPFWDREIELVMLSHPHADHVIGLIALSKYYKIGTFVTENLKNNTFGYQTLLQSLSSQKIKINYIYAGDKLKIKDGVSVEFVGPSKDFVLVNSPDGLIGESGEKASLESLIKYKDFSVLLTGDSQEMELEEALRQAQGFSPVSILQIPHHGSKTGLNLTLLQRLSPKLAIISVGKDNKYGHPAKEVLKILNDLNIKTLRTDEDGDIEIVTDGERYGLKLKN